MTRVSDLPLARLLRILVTVAIAPLWEEIALLHYRGSFQNPFMWIPVASLPVVFSGMVISHFKQDEKRSRALFRPFTAWLVFLGMAGTVFHLIGVRRQMGGFFNWKFNLMTGPPFPAPPQVALIGLIGLGASAGQTKRESQHLSSLIDRVNSAGYLLLATEAGYNHWAGNFFNPVMFTPLILGPLASLAHLSAIIRPKKHPSKAIFLLSVLTTLTGLVGFGFHLWNIGKRPGRWRLHNFFYGAPVVAPLQISAYGLMGLLATVSRARK